MEVLPFFSLINTVVGFIISHLVILVMLDMEVP